MMCDVLYGAKVNSVSDQKNVKKYSMKSNNKQNYKQRHTKVKQKGSNK